MTKKALAIAFVVVLSMAVAMVSARVQASFPLGVNIPFDFVVGKQTLPAGEYRIERLFSDKLDALLIRSTDGRASTIMMTMAVLANDWQSESKLVFNRYGDQYFLSQIWTAGNKSGRELYKSPREAELARQAVKREVAVLPHPSPAKP